MWIVWLYFLRWWCGYKDNNCNTNYDKNITDKSMIFIRIILSILTIFVILITELTVVIMILIRIINIISINQYNKRKRCAKMQDGNIFSRNSYDRKMKFSYCSWKQSGKKNAIWDKKIKSFWGYYFSAWMRDCKYIDKHNSIRHFQFVLGS